MYKDIISKSRLICSGPPAVYQVKPKKEIIETLTKLTIGERNLNKANRAILLVGETGAGKSSLVNALANYAMGVKFEDDIWFQIIVDEEKEGQTSDVIVYQIFGHEDQTLPFSLTIIDTPGYGDTRGIKHDEQISLRMLDLFRSEDGVHQIHAVGLVMKASDNRLSDRLMYVFNSVMSLFGKDLEKNIVALITHSDGTTPRNALKALEVANIKSSRDKFIYFLFNNCQHEDRTKEREFLERANQTSLKGFNELIKFIDKTKPLPLETTVEVLNERIRMMACIQNLKDRIKMTEQKQKEIGQFEDILRKHNAEVKENANFTIEVDEPYKDKEPISGGMWWWVFLEGAVTCNTCEETCHYPGCTMARKPEHCQIMMDGCCTVCTNKCPASDHVKENWRYVTKTRKVQKTLNDVKEKYENKKAQCESLLINLEETTKILTAERSMLLDEAYSHVIKLEKIALKVDSVSTLVHLDFLIEKTKKKGDQEKVKKLGKIKNQLSEATNRALIYAKIRSLSSLHLQ
uniref:AIG1-type G domain-containing protein n=1 Tax=Poecilia reticulata TaxID=8081 RepID=A0A3P9PEL5_POERE